MQEQYTFNDNNNVYDCDGDYIYDFNGDSVDQVIDYNYKKSNECIENIIFALNTINNRIGNNELVLEQLTEINNCKYIISTIKDELELYFQESYCPWGDEEILCDILKDKLSVTNFNKLEKIILDWFDVDKIIRENLYRN